MTRIALIAGTYAPDRCEVADYIDRLRTALSQLGIESVVLTTVAAAQGADVWGVVPDWHLKSLLALARAVHQSQADNFAHSTRGGDLWLRSRYLFTSPTAQNYRMA